MTLIQKLLAFLKKIGVVQTELSAGTYKKATDKNYRLPDPPEA